MSDDQIRHAHCGACQDNPPRGTPFLALCGRTAVGTLGISVEHIDDFPPGLVPCPECLELMDEPCPWCGAEAP